METTEIIVIIVFSSIILLLLSVLVVNLLLLGRNRRLKHQNQLLEVHASFEQALAKTQLEVAEQTMNDTARDLHDDVSQMLTFSLIQLKQLNDIDHPEIHSNILKAQEAVQQSLQSIRNISKTLSTDYLNTFGIRNALELLKERASKYAQVTCSLDIDSTILFEHKAKEIFLFRIIQELMSNTLKHAQANQIHIQLHTNNNQIQLQYTDDGKGFEISNINEAQGLGLSNIRKRAALLDAIIDIETGLGKGFKTIISFNNTSL